MKERIDIHQVITDQVIAAIEAGVSGDFQLPWQRGGAYSFTPKNANTGNAYNGVNVVQLWAVAEAKNYPHALWGSYKQWADLGAHVRKGEKAALVCFFKEYDVEPNPGVEGDDGKRRVARASPVFNVAQVDGYEMPEAPAPRPLIERLEHVEAFLAATGAVVKVGGDRAFYSRLTDHIQLPPETLFTGDDPLNRRENFYSVWLHEQTHWTGAGHRLNRQFGERFGDDAYAFEELCAQLGACMLCADLGISVAPRPEDNQYVDHWLRVMKGDKKAIFAAAARASEAAKYLARFSEARHAQAA